MMTSEQMIRELRAVAEKYKGKHVFTCETNINLMATDAANRIESLCDEISRQKAEIERLKNLNIKLDEYIVRARAEAVKEFAERLKEELTTGMAVMRVSTLDIIDNLVKEFTEGRGTNHEATGGTAASGDDTEEKGGGCGVIP